VIDEIDCHLPIKSARGLPFTFFEFNTTNFSHRTPLIGMTMTRTHYMTIGLLLVLIGIQLYAIETYVLTSQASEFLDQRDTSAENQPANQLARQQPFQSPFYSASYAPSTGIGTANQPPKTITPPRWLCWPIGFLGSVLALHGLAMRKSS
jgi:hypothetical protein